MDPTKSSRLRALVAVLATLIAAPAALAADTIMVEITADGMCCNGCAKTVAAQLYTAPGVVNVQPDVPRRLVTITARPSRSLTLEKLWNAVEKGKGQPSKLVSGDVSYAFAPIDAVPAAERVSGNVYRILVADLQARQSSGRVAKSIQQHRGVGAVRLDAAHDALVVSPTPGAKLSPWALLAAVEQAQEQTSQIDCPHGRLTIQRTHPEKSVSARPQTQGATR